MTAAEVRDGTELERVEEWRREELERAGYSIDLARRIARRHDIDLHAAIELVDRGCPAEIAARILL
jgi:hypothetical protein